MTFELACTGITGLEQSSLECYYYRLNNHLQMEDKTNGKRKDLLPGRL